MLGAFLLAVTLATSPPNNLLLGRPVEGAGLEGALASVTNGQLRPEGEPGTPDRTVVLKSAKSYFTVDLGAVQELCGLVIQCDADDVYMVDRSVDGNTWFRLVEIPALPNRVGLQTRWVRPQNVQPARFLAVHAEAGDGHYFVSQLQAYSILPTPWPAERVLSPTEAAAASRAPEISGFTDAKMVAVKGMTAAAGAALLFWGVILARRRQPGASRGLRDALLAGLGLLSLASWWNLGFFHFQNFVHTWDTFHYYVGAKYFPELGYTDLYECAVAANLAAGRIPPGTVVTATNLLTNHLEPLDPGVALQRCTARFTPDRWQGFVTDVSWFRERVSPDVWHRILQDHGYNGTPAWGVLGSLLANTGPATDEQIGLLTAIDSFLLLVMWGFVTWAFGWRGACVGLLFWGTNYPARFWWNGGAFLRMDWLVCTVVAVCLLKRGKPRAGGALLGIAMFLRIFPGVVLLALVLTAIARWLSERKITVTLEERHIVQGALAAAILLLPLSLVVAGGGHRIRWTAWEEFEANGRKHIDTPLTNNMGLETILTYRLDTRATHLKRRGDPDPFEAWKEAHRATASRMAPVFLLLALGAAGGFAILLHGRPAWVVAAAGVGLISALTTLTCYYYSVFLVLALLWVERQGIGAAFAAVAAVSCVVPAFLSLDEDRYPLLSLIFLAATAWTLWLLRRRKDEALLTELEQPGRIAFARRRSRRHAVGLEEMPHEAAAFRCAAASFESILSSRGQHGE